MPTQRHFVIASVFVITALLTIAIYTNPLSGQVPRVPLGTEGAVISAPVGAVIPAPVILGTVNPNRKYAVFSTTSAGDQESVGFLFLLPLTALAWKRVGFDSVIIIVGSQNVWNSDPLLFSVLERVRSLDAVVLFVSVHPTNSVMVSQVGRATFSSLLPKLRY